LTISWRSLEKERRSASNFNDSNSYYELPDGSIIHSVKLHGVFKDASGWHIKNEDPKIYHVNFGNQWEGMSHYRKGRLTKKQRRAFMRLNSGLSLGVARKERLVFLTLTTKYDLDDSKNRLCNVHGLNSAWTKLKQAIERYLRMKMYVSYCKKHHLIPFEQRRGNKKSVKYSSIYEKIKFKMKYFKVKTSEGGGVLHIVFRKGYNVPKIDKDWLHSQWSKIWLDSWNTSISQIKYTDAVKTAFYIVGNYLQNQPILRMSYGRMWVFQGFRKSFLHLIDVYDYKRALEIWKKNMANNVLPTVAGTWQIRFQWRNLKTLVKYPLKCYDYKGRLVRLPKGKIVLSKPLRTRGTTQSHFGEFNQYGISLSLKL
jgi:hypothetical protein